MQIRNGRALSPPSLDAQDRSIIEILRTNGRATNLDIAKQLSVTPATISSRLQKLEDARAMRVVAVTDFAALGYNVIIAVGVKVRGRDTQEVGQFLYDHIAGIPGVAELDAGIAVDIVKFEFNVVPL